MTDLATTDIDLLRAVRDLRDDSGACSLRQLAAHFGVSLGTIGYRVDQAAARGELERTPMAGSLRPAPAGLVEHRLTSPDFAGEVLVYEVGGELMDARVSP